MSTVTTIHAATVNAIADVTAERVAQDRKWGEQNHAPEVWLAILTEEVGELATEMLRHRFEDITERYKRQEKMGIGWEPEQDEPLRRMRSEAIQVAAVAVALVECLDRASPLEGEL